MTRCDQVHTRVEDGVAVLELDRPKAINALDVPMIHAIASALKGWQVDESVQRIEIRGLGERGFCSGADVRAIRQLVLDDPQAAVAFFRVEYGVNRAIAASPKPITAHLHGISMGGGLGLALHAQHVVASPDLRLAMPEVGIGLFPDVGIAWHLARVPNQVGTWMAMTGAEITAREAQWLGLVHEVALAEGEVPDESESWIAANAHWIDECFVGNDPAAIVAALEAHDDPEARDCAALIRTRSPWSVAVALEAVRRAATMTVDEVLDQDLRLAANFVSDSDFVEGVRAQLVDKDRNPTWRHASLYEVPRELVESMFE